MHTNQHGTEILKLSHKVWSDCPGILIFHLPLLKHLTLLTKTSPNTESIQRHMSKGITEMLQTSLIPMFCSAKRVHLLRGCFDCCSLMDRKIRSKWGTLILYIRIKIYQVFFTPLAAEHQRADFSLEYSVWGKFYLSPAPGQSSQQRRIGGSAVQGDGTRKLLT